MAISDLARNFMGGLFGGGPARAIAPVTRPGLPSFFGGQPPRVLTYGPGGGVTNSPSEIARPIHPIFGGVRSIIPKRTHQPVRIARPVRHPIARPVGTQTGTVARPVTAQF